MNGSEATSTADHDLLIQVDTNVKNMQNTLHAYTNTTSQMMQDHETRLRIVETANSEIRGAQKSQKNLLVIVSVIGGLIGTALTIITFMRG